MTAGIARSSSQEEIYLLKSSDNYKPPHVLHDLAAVCESFGEETVVPLFYLHPAAAFAQELVNIIPLLLSVHKVRP